MAYIKKPVKPGPKKPIERRGYLPGHHAPYMITDRSGFVEVAFDGRHWKFLIAGDIEEAEEYLVSIIHAAFDMGDAHARKEVRNELRSILGLPTED